MSDAPAAAPRAGDGAALAAAAGALEAALARDAAAAVPDAELQRVLAAALRVLAAKHEAGHRLAPFAPPGAVSATEVAVAATALLDAAGIAVFELGMWQTLRGRG